MLLNSWLKNLTARFGRAPARPIRRSNAYRLTLDPLESRLAPAVHTRDGGAASDKWSEAANWDAAGIPTSGEADGTIVLFGTGSPSFQNIPGLVVDEIIFNSDNNTLTLLDPL